MISRPSDKEKVDRYVGQIERVHKQLYRMTESMTITLDSVVDLHEERRLRQMLNRVVNAANSIDIILKEELPKGEDYV